MTQTELDQLTPEEREFLAQANKILDEERCKAGVSDDAVVFFPAAFLAKFPVLRHVKGVRETPALAPAVLDINPRPMFRE